MGVAVRNEGRKVNSNINVTPMVDVMLVLLIIFMVITPMLQNKVADRHGQGGQRRSHARRRQGRRDCRRCHPRWRCSGPGQGRSRSARQDGGDKLADKTDKTIYVRADARAQYKAVEDAIDDVRTAGVDEVAC
jgi:biopolymer transport protein TolR